MSGFDVNKKLKNTILGVNFVSKYDKRVIVGLVKDVFRASNVDGSDMEIALLGADVLKSMAYYPGDIQLSNDKDNLVIFKGKVPILATVVVPFDAFSNEAMASTGSLIRKKKVIGRGLIFGDNGVFINYLGGDNFIEAIPDYSNDSTIVRGHLKYRYVPIGEDSEKKIVIDREQCQKVVYSHDGTVVYKLDIKGLSLDSQKDLSEKIKK